MFRWIFWVIYFVLSRIQPLFLSLSLCERERLQKKPFSLPKGTPNLYVWFKLNLKIAYVHWVSFLGTGNEKKQSFESNFFAIWIYIVLKRQTIVYKCQRALVRM